METLLPNGTIVFLKGGNKRLMIYERKQLTVDEEETMYDYLSVSYPEGYINEKYTYVFNHSDILDTIHEGYVDEEEDEFQKNCAKLSLANSI